MNNKIITLKQKNKDGDFEKRYPRTVATAVYTESGESVEEKIKDLEQSGNSVRYIDITKLPEDGKFSCDTPFLMSFEGIPSSHFRYDIDGNRYDCMMHYCDMSLMYIITIHNTTDNTYQVAGFCQIDTPFVFKEGKLLNLHFEEVETINGQDAQFWITYLSKSFNEVDTVACVSLLQFMAYKTIDGLINYNLYAFNLYGEIFVSHSRDYGHLRFDCFEHYIDGVGTMYVITDKTRIPTFKGYLNRTSINEWKLYDDNQTLVETLEGKTTQEWKDYILPLFNEDLRDKIEATNQNVANIQNDINTINGRLNGVDNDINDLGNRVDITESNIFNLKQKVSAAQDDATLAKQGIETVSKNLEETSEKVDTLKTGLDNTDQNITNLQTEVDNLVDNKVIVTFTNIVDYSSEFSNWCTATMSKSAGEIIQLVKAGKTVVVKYIADEDHPATGIWKNFQYMTGEVKLLGGYEYEDENPKFGYISFHTGLYWEGQMRIISGRIRHDETDPQFDDYEISITADEAARYESVYREFVKKPYVVQNFEWMEEPEGDLVGRLTDEDECRYILEKGFSQIIISGHILNLYAKGEDVVAYKKVDALYGSIPVYSVTIWDSLGTIEITSFNIGDTKELNTGVKYLVGAVNEVNQKVEDFNGNYIIKAKMESVTGIKELVTTTQEIDDIFEKVVKGEATVTLVVITENSDQSNDVRMSGYPLGTRFYTCETVGALKGISETTGDLKGVKDMEFYDRNGNGFNVVNLSESMDELTPQYNIYEIY